MKDSKKQILVALAIILILFILSFIFFFCIWKNENSRKSVEGLLNIQFSNDFGKSISLNNTLPVSDKLGKDYDGQGVSEGIQGYSEFVIDNTSTDSVDFEIYLTKNDTSNTLSGKYVKLYLTDENDNALDGYNKNLLPTISSLGVLNDKPNALLMYRGKINALEKRSFKLRVWLADTYAISKNEEMYSFDINIRAV